MTTEELLLAALYVEPSNDEVRNTLRSLLETKGQLERTQEQPCTFCQHPYLHAELFRLGQVEWTCAPCLAGAIRAGQDMLSAFQDWKAAIAELKRWADQEPEKRSG